MPDARKALSADNVPCRTRALPVPATLTPPLPVADSAPVETVNVAVRLPLPASGSEKEIPFSDEATSSVTMKLAGAVIAGA